MVSNYQKPCFVLASKCMLRLVLKCVNVSGAEWSERVQRLLCTAHRLLEAEETERALQQRQKPRLHKPSPRLR